MFKIRLFRQNKHCVRPKAGSRLRFHAARGTLRTEHAQNTGPFLYVFSKENEQNGKLPLKQLSVLLYTSAESRRRCVLHIFQGIRPRIVQLCFSPVHALHHDVHRRSRLLHRPEADDIVRRRLSEEHLITEIHNGDPIRRLKFVFSFSEMQSIFFGDTQKSNTSCAARQVTWVPNVLAQTSPKPSVVISARGAINAFAKCISKGRRSSSCSVPSLSREKFAINSI